MGGNAKTESFRNRKFMIEVMVIQHPHEVRLLPIQVLISPNMLIVMTILIPLKLKSMMITTMISLIIISIMIIQIVIEVGSKYKRKRSEKVIETYYYNIMLFDLFQKKGDMKDG